LSSHGLQTIYRLDTGAELTVYCDFTTPNQAWTLIESFTFSNNWMYKSKPLHIDFSRNIHYPSEFFQDFRLPLDTMKYLSSRSIQFRATCKFPSRTAAGENLKNRDFLLGSLKEYDMTNRGHFTGCVTYEYINIRGQEYFNQSAFTFHNIDAHIHIEPDVGSCGFVVPDKIAGEEFFGFYNPQNTKFLCVESSGTTTNWWFGGEIHECL